MLTIAKELLLNKYVAYFLATALIVAGFYFAWEHYVATPYRDEGKAIGLVAGLAQGKALGITQGRAAERAELMPTIEALTLRLDNDVKAFESIQASMLLITRNSENIKQAVKKAAAINATRNKAAETRVEYIDRIVPVGATECEKTADAVAKVLR